MATPPPDKKPPSSATHGLEEGSEPAGSGVRSSGSPGSDEPGTIPSGVPSVAPTRVELRKGSAPKAPSVPRELVDNATQITADDGLVELKDEDIELVRNPSDHPIDPSSKPPPTGELPAISQFGRYEILGRLAFGGMAEIFLSRERAEHGASRYLVIKRILPHVADEESFVEMFLDEARLAMQLNHPSICHIYEFGQLNRSYFIAMEWINGVPLGKLIRRAREIGGVPPEIAAKIISRIAEALHYAHKARDQMGRPLGIVHRDVSPHNIMVSYDGNVKLLDFGIAKASTHSTKTKAGVIKGKFSYMSPQQCLGQPIDGRADVYALGVCMWEALTGKPLYHRKTEYETMRAVIEETTPPLQSKKPGLPKDLDAIVQKAVAKRAEDRYQSAGEMQAAIEQWLADSRKVVSSARIGDLMEKLYAEEIERGPLVDTQPFGMSLNQAPGTPASGEAARGSLGTGGDTVARPQSRVPWLVAALMGILAIGAGLFAALSGEEEPAPQPVVAQPEPEPEPEPEPAVEPEPEPVVEPEPEPQFGALVIRSRPPGASIKLGDRELTETTPTILTEIPAGMQAITLTHDGYQTWEGEVEVVGDERANVSAELEREPRPRVRRAPATPPGRLSINTRPWSKVYVGGRLIGTTPIGGAQVPSGAVRLRLVDRDGRTHTRTVRVPANGEAREFFDLN